jgi:hypothetical protein
MRLMEEVAAAEAALASDEDFDFDQSADEHPRGEGVTSLPLPVELFGSIRPQFSQRYLLKGLLMASTTIVVFGLPGCGKSFLCLDWGLRIAAVREWFGQRVAGGGVVYIGAEGQAGLRLRVEAWKREVGEDREIPFALIPTAVDLLDPEADIAKLEIVLRFLSNLWGGIALITVDTLAASFGAGDENGPDMAAYVGNIARLCLPYDCARMIVTHAPLAVDAKRPRGHSSLWGAADTVLHISGDRGAPARRIHVLKQKDMDPGPDILFTLKSVEIGTDEDGEPVTSCVVQESDMDPSEVRGGRKLSPKEKIAVSQLGRMLEEEGRLPPGDIPDKVLNRARTGKVVEMSAWRSAAISALCTPDIQPDSARTTFNRVKEKLQASDIIGIWEDWAWLI